MSRLTLAIVSVEYAPFFRGVTDENVAAGVERHDARQEPPSLLVRKHVDAAASNAGHDGVGGTEVDADDRHRNEGLSMIRSAVRTAASLRSVLEALDHLTEPSANGGRKGPHPAVIRADVAAHDLALEPARGVQPVEFGRGDDRLHVGLPLDARAPPGRARS